MHLRKQKNKHPKTYTILLGINSVYIVFRQLNIYLGESEKERDRSESACFCCVKKKKRERGRERLAIYRELVMGSGNVEPKNVGERDVEGQKMWR